MTEFSRLRKMRQRLSTLDRSLSPLSREEKQEATKIISEIQSTGWRLCLSQKLLDETGLEGEGWRGKTSPFVHKKAARRGRGHSIQPKKPSWRRLRYAALERAKGKCECCGRSAADDVVLHVDHIKPESRFPELARELSNLQVLCGDCNLGKSNFWDTDWRPNTAMEKPEMSAIAACSASAEHGSHDA